MNIGELFVKLAFNVENTTLKDAVSLIGDLNVASVGSLGLLQQMAEQFDETNKKAIELARGLGNFKTTTGESSENAQKYAQFVKDIGLSSEQAYASVSQLIHTLNAPIKSGEQAGAIGWFNLAGIRDSEQALDRIRQKIKESKDPTAIAIDIQQMKALGLAEQDFIALKKDEYEEYKKNWILHQENIKALTEEGNAWAKMKTNIENTRIDWVKEYAPFLTDIAKLGATVFDPINHASKELNNTTSLWMNSMLIGLALLFPGSWPIVGMTLLAEGALMIAKNWDLVKTSIAGASDAMKEIYERKGVSGVISAALTGNEDNTIGSAGIMGIGEAFGKALVGGNSQNNSITVNVNGAEHPHSIGEKVVDAIKQAFETTIRQQDQKRV